MSHGSFSFLLLRSHCRIESAFFAFHSQGMATFTLAQQSFTGKLGRTYMWLWTAHTEVTARPSNLLLVSSAVFAYQSSSKFNWCEIHFVKCIHHWKSIRKIPLGKYFVMSGLMWSNLYPKYSSPNQMSISVKNLFPKTLKPTPMSPIFFALSIPILK